MSHLYQTTFVVRITGLVSGNGRLTAFFDYRRNGTDIGTTAYLVKDSNYLCLLASWCYARVSVVRSTASLW